jgi:hypothetical protein
VLTRYNSKTALGPSEWFTGAVYLGACATPSGASHVNALGVRFAPHACPLWHTQQCHLSDHASDQECAAAPAVDR